jgi:hypothetical protein
MDGTVLLRLYCERAELVNASSNTRSQKDFIEARCRERTPTATPARSVR